MCGWVAREKRPLFRLCVLLVLLEVLLVVWLASYEHTKMETHVGQQALRPRNPTTTLVLTQRHY